jgi:hypothetical protein
MHRENDAGVDGVFRVITHDVVGHGVVGFRDIAEFLAENFIAEGGFVDADELAAACDRQSVKA